MLVCIIGGTSSIFTFTLLDGCKLVDQSKETKNLSNIHSLLTPYMSNIFQECFFGKTQMLNSTLSGIDYTLIKVQNVNTLIEAYQKMK